MTTATTAVKYKNAYYTINATVNAQFSELEQSRTQESRLRDQLKEKEAAREDIEEKLVFVRRSVTFLQVFKVNSTHM